MKNFKDRHKPKYLSYSFDWDDNILYMPTKIHMDKIVNGEWLPIDVSTSKFSKIRNDTKYRFRDNDINITFSEFRDTGKRGENAFIEDVKKAILKERFGHSWNDFLEAIVNGSLVSIITARGHNPDTIKKAVRWIIDTQLTKEQKDEMVANLMGYLSKFEDIDILNINMNFDELVDYYLSFWDFYGITSPFFLRIYPGSVSNPEEAKKRALTLFIKKIKKFGKKIDADVHLGFSDDDKGNVDAIRQLFNDEPSLADSLKFYLYDTSKSKNKVNEILTFKKFKHING